MLEGDIVFNGRLVQDTVFVVERGIGRFLGETRSQAKGESGLGRQVMHGGKRLVVYEKLFSNKLGKCVGSSMTNWKRLGL